MTSGSMTTGSSPEDDAPKGSPAPTSAPLTPAVTQVVEWLFDEPVLNRIDAEVERATRRLLLDTLGCMIGGGRKPELRALATSLATLEAGPVALPGMAERLTAPAAAYWAAMAATWDEACEGLARAHGRPGLHAFAPAMALTLARGGSLGDAVGALLRGFEVAGRLGERLRIRPGMHVDGTWGSFGAVAAAGSIFGHSSKQVMAGIEAAACQTPMSLYLPVAQGATVRNSYVAEAARRAIHLTLCVEAGVTTPGGALETFEALALGPDPAEVSTIAPAHEWLLPQGYLKPYAAVRHVHYGARAAYGWLGAGRRTDTIEAIALDVYPEAVTYCGNRAPTSAIGAQFSLTYGVARMLATGDLGPDAYTEAALRDPEVQRLERLIELRAAPGSEPDQRYATLRIRTSSGDDDTIHVDHVVGDAGHPLSDDEVVAKFVAYCQGLGPDYPAADVAALVLDGPMDQPLSEAIGSGPTMPLGGPPA